MQRLDNPYFKEQERRYKIMQVSPCLLFDCLFSGIVENGMVRGIEITLDGKPLPKDIQVQAMMYDILRNVVSFRLWSSEWGIVEEEMIPPEANVLITSRLYDVYNQVPKNQKGCTPSEILEEIASLKEDLQEEIPGSSNVLKSVGKEAGRCAKCNVDFGTIDKYESQWRVKWQGSIVLMCLKCAEQIV